MLPINWDLNIEKALRKQGFKNDLTDGLICRWEIDGFILDVMPTDPNILGFTNAWYEPALKFAQKHDLEPNLDILLISATYFLATKLEAFKNRGGRDFYASHDLEDIITLLDGRESIFKEIYDSESNLKSFLVENFKEYKKDVDFIQSLSGHLAPYNIVTSERLESIIKKITKIKN